MFDKQSVDLARYFLRSYPRRTAFIVGLLILAGMAEGVSLVSLVPLLEVAVSDEGTHSALGQSVEQAMGVLGVRPTLGMLLIVIILGMILKAGFVWIAGNQVGYTTARVATDLRLMIIRSLLKARWGYFTSRPAGHVANAINHEAHRAAGAYREVCSLLAGTVQVTIYMAVAIMVSWQVALLGLVAAIGIAFILRRFVELGRAAGRGKTIRSKALLTRMTDALQGMKAIKAMGREENLLPLLERETFGLNEALQKTVRAAETRRAFHEPLLVLVVAAGLYAALTVGEQPFSGLLVLAFLFYRVAGQVNNLQSHYQSLANCESAFWSLKEQVEAAEVEAESSSGKKRLEHLSDGILIEDVTFAYGSHEVLNRVSLDIPAGSFTAVVGPSGSGKTTLADLIVGLHKVQAGDIRIDGVPIEQLNIVKWRHMIGYVPQEMLLFHDSILNNVTLGSENVSLEEVWAALTQADAASFVDELPEGLDTVIGERGAKLSGGQRQRIAIARALVRKPALLVLDEVTTALDPKTEAEICSTLKRLAGQVTIMAISHQPAIKDAADRVYRIDGGRVFREPNTIGPVASHSTRA